MTGYGKKSSYTTLILIMIMIIIIIIIIRLVVPYMRCWRMSQSGGIKTTVKNKCLQMPL